MYTTHKQISVWLRCDESKTNRDIASFDNTCSPIVSYYKACNVAVV